MFDFKSCNRITIKVHEIISVHTKTLMSTAIICSVVLKHAPRILPLAKFLIKVAMALKSKGLRLDEKAKKIAGHYYWSNYVVHLMDVSDLEKIELMGRLIACDAEITMHDESNILPVSGVGKASGRGRSKMTAYSVDQLKQQALLLNKIRRSHARGAVALIRSMRVLVKRMRRIDAKVQRTITKKLRAIGDEIDNVGDQGFEHKEYSFGWALEMVNEALDEAQAVADAPSLP
jgi:hypothetical protein